MICQKGKTFSLAEWKRKDRLRLKSQVNDLTNYDKYAPLIRSMDCLAYKGNSLLGKAIRIFSPGWNHIGLAFQLPKYEGTVNRRWTLQADAPGVVLYLLSRDLGEYDGEVWWYPLKDEFEPLRDKATEWALCQVGIKYDFGSLFKNILGRVSLDLKKMFCSEFAYAAWMNAGIVPLTDTAPRPADVIKLDIYKEPVRLI